MVKADIKEYSEFPLFGGPLHRLGVRLRLVRPGGNSILLGLALGMSVWLILLILAAVQGNLSRFFSVNVFAGHVRFLIAIPLFFTCETLIAPRMSDLVNYLLHAEIVTGKEKTGLDAAIGTIRRLRDSSWPEGIFFLLVMALPFMGFSGFLPGQSDDVKGLIEQAGKLTLVNTVYIGFALPLFRFLFLRWLWQLGLWVYFLYRLNKLRLRLIPIHSDGTGGLGYLEEVQVYFFPLALAFSAIISASLAEDILSGALPFASLYYAIPASILLSLLFFAFPLFLFSNKLRESRIKGMHDYMTMAAHYSQFFEQRWIKEHSESSRSQLGSADIQSLADLTNSINVIRDMRIVPVSRELILAYVAAVLIPYIPFMFIRFSFNDILLQLFQIIAG